MIAPSVQALRWPAAAALALPALAAYAGFAEAALAAAVALPVVWLAATRRPQANLPVASPTELDVAEPNPAQPNATTDIRASRVARLWQLGEITATIAHDLGQPLNILCLTAEAALDGLECGRADPNRLRRALAAAIEQPERMQEMIDLLLAATRKPAEPPAPLNPVEVVRQALSSVLPRLRTNGVRLSWHAQLTTPRVAGHAPRLGMAVRQAVINANEALADQGFRDDGPASQLSVSCTVEGAEVVIAVADNGPGFPPSLLATLDEPLPDNGDKRTGIGLAIILGVAAEMGGSVSITDAAPGTRLEIRLPALPGPSVLVAGQAPANLTEVLTRQGWRVQVVDSLAAALAQLELAHPEVVLTTLTGDEADHLLDTLRHQQPSLPVIAVTVSAENARAAVAAGAVVVLNAPVTAEEIAQELNDILRH